MIFQSLIGLYDRLAKTEAVPPYGFSVEDIGFVVTIDEAGNLIGQPEDLRIKKKNKFDFRQSIVPYTNQVNVRSGNAATAPNFMTDKADYIFGMSGKSMTPKYRESFTTLIDDVCGSSQDKGILAVKAFLEKWRTEDSVHLEFWKEICGTHGKWVAFRLRGDYCFVHERDEVQSLWSDYTANNSFPVGLCFVDGKSNRLQPQYTQFKFGKGAPITTFNKKAYWSYGKERGENAPISVEAEFKSSSALKFLFRNKSQRLWINDTVVVYWAEKETGMEGMFGTILNPHIEDQAAALPIQKFLESVRNGELPGEVASDENTKFYILGFSVTESRLALRYSLTCSVGDLLERLRDHFDNLEMERSEKDIPYPGIWHLLRETARESKDILPVLGGALTRSVLTGASYPQNLYQGVIGRIRADQRINYLRASILKAVLKRNHNKEVPMALDTERRDEAYLLGRLFAALEQAQYDALGKVKTSIKNRFFSSASATPASVFPRLINLSQHHIEKAEYGYTSERRIAEIVEHVESFPVHMDLQQQGLFAIAYYHQKNAIDREIKKAIANKKSANQEVGK